MEELYVAMGAAHTRQQSFSLSHTAVCGNSSRKGSDTAEECLRRT